MEKSTLQIEALHSRIDALEKQVEALEIQVLQLKTRSLGEDPCVECGGSKQVRREDYFSFRAPCPKCG